LVPWRCHGRALSAAVRRSAERRGGEKREEREEREGRDAGVRNTML